MTASEFAFLALGLALGVLSGAALLEVLRSRPRSPREVRLTVTPNSIPARRSTTLAEDAFGTSDAPVPGGPEAAAVAPRLPAPAVGHGRGAESGTDVPSALPQQPAEPADVPRGMPLPATSASAPRLSLAPLPEPRLPVVALPDPGRQSAPIARRPAVGPARGPDRFVPQAPRGQVAVPIHRETDWTLAALRETAARTAEQALRGQRLTAAAILERPRAVPGPTAGPSPRAEAGDPARSAGSQPTVPGSAEPAASDPCAEPRRVADERCAVATRAREQAEAAQEALRTAQRDYDERLSRAEAASVAADPRALRAAKEAAHDVFRRREAAATTAAAIETAARDWLNEINRISQAAREAALAVHRERRAGNALAATIERLVVEAEAAGMAADAAEAACTAAREAVTDCEERPVPPPQRAPAPATAPAAAGPAAAPSPTIAPPPVVRPPIPPATPSPAAMRPLPPEAVEQEPELAAGLLATGGGEPAILRLLRGDRATLTRVVAELGGADPAEQRRWQLAIARLVDAIVARAIEASALTFPDDHPFWRNFTTVESRDIVSALSSFGYRFDGLGGWTDDRTPGQRDLSLAVGYAGVDPMRIRKWPTEAEMNELFRDVAVAADEYLADAARALTLGELVGVLGRRAEGLADVWNEWPSIRPRLLSGS